MKIRTLIAYLLLTLATTLYGQQSEKSAAPHPTETISLTLQEALEIMESNNKAIRQSGIVIEMAKAEKGKLNAAWYPILSTGGSYIHFSNEIEAKEELGELIQPILESSPELAGITSELLPILQHYLQGMDLGKIISNIGSLSLEFPLLEQDITTIDGTIMWPLFTGGKRIYANRIGKSAIKSAELLHKMTSENQTLLLTERYYTAKLTSRITSVCSQNLHSMELLYKNSLKMMENGVINKAEMLTAKVAYQEALREYENALNNQQLATEALEKSLGWKMESENNGDVAPESGNSCTRALHLSSPFFMVPELPQRHNFHAAIESQNPQLELIGEQKKMTLNQYKISRSGYLPNIALFGKQNLYSYNIPKNLAPRSVIGAGFVWNIFDGLNREKSMQLAKLEYNRLNLGEEDARENLYLLANTLYNRIEDASNDLKMIETSVELAKELVKMREKSFKEGMSTSWECINAHTLLAKVESAAIMAYYQYDLALSALLALVGESGGIITYMNNPNNLLYEGGQ